MCKFEDLKGKIIKRIEKNKCDGDIDSLIFHISPTEKYKLYHEQD